MSFTYIFPTHNFSLCTKGFERCISGISVSFDKEFLFNAPITLQKIIKISMLFQKLRRIPKLYCEHFSLKLLSVAEIAPVKVVH